MSLLMEVNKNKNLFLRQYLETIEQVILGYQNYECFYDVLTKERDNENQFKNMMAITKKNINCIFLDFDLKNLEEVHKLYEKRYIEIDTRTKKAKGPQSNTNIDPDDENENENKK